MRAREVIPPRAQAAACDRQKFFNHREPNAMGFGAKLGDFEFRATAAGAKVYLKKKYLGEIVTCHEGNGRHCFRLGCDQRKKPRTYRGRLNAAMALSQIAELAQKAKRHAWSQEKLILEAWDARPLVADYG